jgi:hypothetical protein
MGLHLRRPKKGLRQSSTEVLQRQDPPLSLGQEVEGSEEPSRILRRAAGHSANQAIPEDNIETFKGQGLAQAGLLAKASVGHQTSLLVDLPRAGEVYSAAFVVGALEVLTEKALPEVIEEVAMAVAAMAEVTGKLKEKVSRRRTHVSLLFFVRFWLARILILTNHY